MTIPCYAQAREAAGFPIDAYTASATITAAGRAKDKMLVEAVLKQTWSAGYISEVVCSAAIQAYARCGDPQVLLVSVVSCTGDIT